MLDTLGDILMWRVPLWLFVLAGWFVISGLRLLSEGAHGQINEVVKTVGALEHRLGRSKEG
jgi:hypothetical protein